MLNLNCINFCQCCSSNRACISCIHQSLKRFSTSRRTVCSFCCSFCPDQIELGYTHIRNVICQISFIPVPLICGDTGLRSEEHTSELQSRGHLVCRLLLEKKNKNNYIK